MMRPQHSMYMQHSGAGGPRSNLPYGGPMGPGGPQHRPPNVQVSSDGMPIGSQQEWRQMMMSQQQQQMGFGPGGAGGPPGGPMRQGPAGFQGGNI